MSTNPTRAISQAVLRAGGRRVLARDAAFAIEGAEWIPARGPCLLVVHHYHHLLDGCALYAATSRPLHVLVGLDWAGKGRKRRVMEALCRMAGWPVILRPDALRHDPGRELEVRRRMRQATREAVDLLRAGQAVVVFPEGYPVIDPHGSPKAETGERFLPFAPGVVRLAAMAERAGAGSVPLVPIGLDYQREGEGRWAITLRVGTPMSRSEAGDDALLLATLETVVRELSGHTL